MPASLAWGMPLSPVLRHMQGYGQVASIYGSSYYTIVDGPTWTAASSNAQSIGGTLAVIEEVSENTFITEYLGNLYI